LSTAHQALAWLLPVLVLVQAALAGQHLFEGGAISLHGLLGNLTFALTLVGVGLALACRCDGVVFGVATALVALSFAQVGLGYVGREALAAAAWHIPNGVAIFGLATYQLALVTRR
jgi:hypothetical protein